MRSDINLPFALKNGEPVHVKDVERGRKCACVCGYCGSPLIAAKGEKNQHHFRHEGGNESERCRESNIHLAAKKIIMQRKQITLPEYALSVTKTDSRGIVYAKREIVVPNGKIIRFDDVQKEIELHGIKADLLATVGKSLLVIEIYYRHKVDDKKQCKIADANVSAVEVDLSKLGREDTEDWERFWAFINDPMNIKWLYNAKDYHAILEKLEKNLREEIQVQEKKYEQEEEIDGKKQEDSEKKIREDSKRQDLEKKQLLQALDSLRYIRSEENITMLKQRAEEHPIWKRASCYLSLSWHELPDFLNVDVRDADWIFGCDRRIWQTSVYYYFKSKERDVITDDEVLGWLQNKAGCKVPQCAEILEKYGGYYPHLLPDDMSRNIPSARETLDDYLLHLVKIEELSRSY